MSTQPPYLQYAQAEIDELDKPYKDIREFCEANGVHMTVICPRCERNFAGAYPCLKHCERLTPTSTTAVWRGGKCDVIFFIEYAQEYCKRLEKEAERERQTLG